MSQISVNGLTFCYEGSFDNIFEDVSFSIDTDWKLGFIGRNGKGKTTFLHILMGKYDYIGSVSASVRFEYFPYPLSDEQIELPASEFITDIKPDCEEWRVIRELSLLSEEADILYRPFSTLSHGERTKVMLAVLFSGENDFLLIDEPTNHLDSSARETVKEYLASKSGFILVSHNRDLLDHCIDHVLVLNRKSIDVQSGNFSVWWENKQRRDTFAVAENEKHKKEIKKLQQSAKRTAEWADKSERTKIGFDPKKEHDRSISARSYIGAKTKKMQKRVKETQNRIAHEIEEKEGHSTINMGTITVAAESPASPVPTPAPIEAITYHTHSILLPSFISLNTLHFILSKNCKNVHKNLRFVFKTEAVVLVPNKPNNLP